MREKIICIFVLLFVIWSAWNDCFAYKIETHMSITEEAFNRSGIETFLVNELNIDMGKFYEDPLGKKEAIPLLRWLRFGSRVEDVASRAKNHFYNPLNNQGVDDIIEGKPAKDWALDGYNCGNGEYEMANFCDNDCNDFNWIRAREAYYGAFAEDDEDLRNKYMVLLFERLGRVAHMLEDMGVPAHVRNDFSGHIDFFETTMALKFPDYCASEDILSIPFTFFENGLGIANNFEAYLEGIISKDEFYVGGLCNNGFSIPIFEKVDEFWDVGEYTEQAANPEVTTDAYTGLSEYTNANFMSTGSLWAHENPPGSKNYFPYPNYFSATEPVPYKELAEDGKEDEVLYLDKETDGESIQKFISYSYTRKLVEDIEAYDDSRIKEWKSILIYNFNECVHESYAEKLIPKTTGYVAGLFKYFFRGRLGVNSILPILTENKVMNIQAKVKNVTPGETMGAGKILCSCRYEDDSDNIHYDTSSPVQITGLGNNDTLMEFVLPNGIPQEYMNDDFTECYLIFEGELGQEDKAVVVQKFDSGEILFNEDWDNGLTGNNNWTHEGDNNPVNIGTVDNVLYAEGILHKENIRYSGETESHYNITTISPTQPLLITPETYCQFKIDNASINDPDSNAFQSLYMEFNNGVHIIYSPQGAKTEMNYVGYRQNSAYVQFIPSNAVVQNIYELLDAWNNAVPAYQISIPDPLYLQRIDFLQQIWSGSSTGEVKQEMDIDFIRIVNSNSNT